VRFRLQKRRLQLGRKDALLIDLYDLKTLGAFGGNVESAVPHIFLITRDDSGGNIQLADSRFPGPYHAKRPVLRFRHSPIISFVTVVQKYAVAAERREKTTISSGIR